MAKHAKGRGRTAKGAPASRTRLTAVAVLSAVGVVLSAWLTWIHLALLRDPTAASACNLGGALNCDTVNASRYATFAGVPVAWLGLTVYGVVLALAVAELRGVSRRPRALGYARWLGLFAVLYSVFLAVVSAFVIQAFCLFCLGLYAVNVALLVAGWRGAGTHFGEWSPLSDLDALLRRSPPTVRTAAVAWLVGTAALVVAERAASKLELPTVAVGGAGAITVTPGQSSGRTDAPLTVALFGDFQCPYCKAASASFDRARETFGDRVRFVYKHFPLDPACNPGAPQGAHLRACDAAAAAVCAAEQGKFWEFHAEVFARGAEEQALLAAAEASGLDTRAFQGCRAGKRARAEVRADIDDGLRLNVPSTPTFLIGDELVLGALSAEQLAERIERALAEPAAGP